LELIVPTALAGKSLYQGRIAPAGGESSSTPDRTGHAIADSGEGNSNAGSTHYPDSESGKAPVSDFGEIYCNL